MSRSACVLWFTGLSGSGKSTIAESLVERLKKSGVEFEYLDGDSIREIFPETGFTKADRERHLKWVGFLASKLEKNGTMVVASFVSPYQESRNFIRGLCKNFIEIYVSTPLAECERRDVKGLYKKARNGEIKNFTGITDPYEPPDRPDLVLDTTKANISECVDQVITIWERKSGPSRTA